MTRTTFEGKTLFVTGGAGGIGRGIVEAFRAAGAAAAFCDCDRERGERTAAETGALFLPADAADAEALRGALEETCRRIGEIDILVNNVGVSEFTPLTATSVEQFDRVIGINLRSAFVTAQWFAVRRDTPEGRRRYGRIVNIASTRWLQSEPHSEAYAASKGGIVSLTHALALSFAEYAVTVNAVSPGWIDTGHYPIAEPDRRQHPSGRVGTPADIARACLFLADPANDFIDGQNLVVDGSMTKKMIYTE